LSFEYSTFAMEGARKFRTPKSAEEENRLLETTVPKITQNSTKWALKLWKECQISRAKKVPEDLTSSIVPVDVKKVHDLNTPLEKGSAFYMMAEDRIKEGMLDE